MCIYHDVVPSIQHRDNHSYVATCLPLHTGRATVEMMIERQDGSLAFFDPKQGGPVKRARLRIEVDGYSAPVSAGNFVANILDGKYRSKTLQVGSHGSVHMVFFLDFLSRDAV